MESTLFVSEEVQIIVGSQEILNYSFLRSFRDDSGALFPSIGHYAYHNLLSKFGLVVQAEKLLKILSASACAVQAEAELDNLLSLQVKPDGSSFMQRLCTETKEAAFNKAVQLRGRQDPEFCDSLLETNTALLVLADVDAVFGVGMSVEKFSGLVQSNKLSSRVLLKWMETPDSQPFPKHFGQNRYGLCLMRYRNQLKLGVSKNGQSNTDFQRIFNSFPLLRGLIPGSPVVSSGAPSSGVNSMDTSVQSGSIVPPPLVADSQLSTNYDPAYPGPWDACTANNPAVTKTGDSGSLQDPDISSSSAVLRRGNARGPGSASPDDGKATPDEIRDQEASISILEELQSEMLMSTMVESSSVAADTTLDPGIVTDSIDEPKSRTDLMASVDGLHSEGSEAMEIEEGDCNEDYYRRSDEAFWASKRHSTRETRSSHRRNERNDRVWQNFEEVGDLDYQEPDPEFLQGVTKNERIESNRLPEVNIIAKTLCTGSEETIFLTGIYKPLSNFYPCSLEVKGRFYRSVIHYCYYQFLKALDLDLEADNILVIKCPKSVHDYAKALTEPESSLYPAKYANALAFYEESFLPVMKSKFSQNRMFESLLASTGESLLVDVNGSFDLKLSVGVTELEFRKLQSDLRVSNEKMREMFDSGRLPPYNKPLGFNRNGLFLMQLREELNDGGASVGNQMSRPYDFVIAPLGDKFTNRGPLFRGNSVQFLSSDHELCHLAVDDMILGDFCLYRSVEHFVLCCGGKFLNFPPDEYEYLYWQPPDCIVKYFNDTIDRLAPPPQLLIQWYYAEQMKAYRAGFLSKFEQRYDLIRELVMTGDALLVICDSSQTTSNAEWTANLDERDLRDMMLTFPSGEVSQSLFQLFSQRERRRPRGLGGNRIGLILMELRNHFYDQGFHVQDLDDTKLKEIGTAVIPIGKAPPHIESEDVCKISRQSAGEWKDSAAPGLFRALPAAIPPGLPEKVLELDNRKTRNYAMKLAKRLRRVRKSIRRERAKVWNLGQDIADSKRKCASLDSLQGKKTSQDDVWTTFENFPSFSETVRNASDEEKKLIDGFVAGLTAGVCQKNQAWKRFFEYMDGLPGERARIGLLRSFWSDKIPRHVKDAMTTRYADLLARSSPLWKEAVTGVKATSSKNMVGITDSGVIKPIEDILFHVPTLDIPDRPFPVKVTNIPDFRLKYGEPPRKRSIDNSHMMPVKQRRQSEIPGPSNMDSAKYKKQSLFSERKFPTSPPKKQRKRASEKQDLPAKVAPRCNVTETDDSKVRSPPHAFKRPNDVTKKVSVPLVDLESSHDNSDIVAELGQEESEAARLLSQIDGGNVYDRSARRDKHSKAIEPKTASKNETLAAQLLLALKDDDSENDMTSPPKSRASIVSHVSVPPKNKQTVAPTLIDLSEAECQSPLQGNSDIPLKDPQLTDDECDASATLSCLMGTSESRGTPQLGEPPREASPPSDSESVMERQVTDTLANLREQDIVVLPGLGDASSTNVAVRESSPLSDTESVFERNATEALCSLSDTPSSERLSKASRPDQRLTDGPKKRLTDGPKICQQSFKSIVATSLASGVGVVCSETGDVDMRFLPLQSASEMSAYNEASRILDQISDIEDADDEDHLDDPAGTSNGGPPVTLSGLDEEEEDVADILSQLQELV